MALNSVKNELIKCDSCPVKRIQKMADKVTCNLIKTNSNIPATKPLEVQPKVSIKIPNAKKDNVSELSSLSEFADQE